MLVLGAAIATYGESFVENTRFGSMDGHFCWKSLGKMFVLKAWSVTFGESLVGNAWGSWKMLCPARVSSKNVKRVSSKRVHSNSVCQESVLSRVSSKSGKRGCPARVSRKSVRKEFLAKSVKKECPVKRVQQECQARVSTKSASVKQECQQKVSRKSV